ncbi:MAG: VOC family protein [Spirochaetales bacterium]|nr:VOC family protein [Spirochaetales bacterium]
MANVFVNTIIFVKDINVSKKFYSEILGMKMLHDYETIIFYENGLTIHLADSILKTVYKESKSSALQSQGQNNILVYFETDKLDELYNKICDKVKIIHGIEKQEWGQKVFRFFDPDEHIVEFGEPFHAEELK